MPLTKPQKNLVAGLIVGASGLVYLLSGRRRRRDCQQLPLTYVERLAGGAQPGDTLPLVVFFHSRGARPEGFAGFANRIKTPARVLFPGGPYVNGDRHSWMQVGSIGPQDQFTSELESSGELAAQFITAAMSCFPTSGKPVVTGTSQGGHMAYYMTSQFPHLVRGGVAIAGYLPPEFWNPAMATTYAAHGSQDTTVPYKRTKNFWDAMEDAGADIATKTYNVGHTTSGMGSWWGARVTELAT